MMFQRRRPFLVAMDWGRPKDPPVSLGLASIVANLQMRKVDHLHRSWAVNNPHFDVDEIVTAVMEESRRSPSTDFAVGAYVWNERFVQQIISKLRHFSFPGNIIIGGPQISYVKSNQELERFYDADVFIRGTAEEPLAKLYQTESNRSSDPAPIWGIHYRGIPDLGKPASSKLDTLASPLLTGIIAPQNFIRWETQRGCPFSCSFCQHREPDKNIIKNNRYFSSSRTAAEIDWILCHPVIQDIAVLDPVFNSGPSYLDTLKALRIGGYKGRISLQAKADMVNEEFLNEITLLRDAGASPILEFGLQTIHKEEQRAITRGNNMKKITHVLNECIAREINHEVSVIFGLPLQTLSSFQETVKYLLDLNVPSIQAWPLMLLRGTELTQRKAEFGLVESHEPANATIDRVQSDIPHVISSDSFSYDDWKQMAALAATLQERNRPHRNCSVAVVAPAIH
jgi:radical SAM superfamily enzyme YgiQ (UPF0313 family)